MMTDIDPGEQAGLRARRRAVVVVAAVALASLAAGIGLSRLVVSPSEAAARTAPPEASLITSTVERRALTTAIVTRGDVAYDEVEEVTIESGGLESPPVVTGAVPKAGDVLEPGEVMVELAGRPVIVLPGDLPTYRSLDPGSSGPDVRQLREALTGLGIDVGEGESDTYDAALAAGVEALYERIGYAPPAPAEQAVQAVEQAREQLRLAEQQLRGAERNLAAAGQGPGEVERLQADAMVRGAERMLAAAKEPDEDGKVDKEAVQEAEENLKIARAQHEEMLAPPDVAAETGEVAAAREAVATAQAELTDARFPVRTPLPASEVVYLPGLPRRVDRVDVSLGDRVDGPVLRAGARRMVVIAALSQRDAALLVDGAPAELDVDGELVAAVVREVRSSTEDAAEVHEAVVEPVDPDGLGGSDGRNLRVTFPLEATDGEVLVVPLAAVSTTSGGVSRVEVERLDGSIDSIEVDVGLASGGDVEVTPVDGALGVGDQVVVGR
jgi:hypothetical protein